MTAPLEAGTFNEYSGMRIPDINNLGTNALKQCVVLELQERELWDDTEVRWAYTFSMDMHDNEQRKDGPYNNHILRAAIWAIREFNTADTEIAKAILLHDVIENHPKDIIELFGGQEATSGTDRERAFVAFCNSNQIARPDTKEAIGRLTCPSFKGYQPIEKRQAYARHITGITLKQPLAAVAKIADQLDNGNGNAYNPDPKMQRRLDLKYYAVNAAFRDAIYMEGSLIPDDRRDFVNAAFEDGQQRAKKRLMRAFPGIPALSEAEVDALTLNTLFRLRDAA